VGWGGQISTFFPQSDPSKLRRCRVVSAVIVMDMRERRHEGVEEAR
jgi:hypothetical protein